MVNNSPANIIKNNKERLNKTNKKTTSPWELMDPRTKNDSDKTQDIRIPYVGNGYV